MPALRHILILSGRLGFFFRCAFDMRSRQPRGEFADIAAVFIFDDGFQNPSRNRSAPDRLTDLAVAATCSSIAVPVGFKLVKFVNRGLQIVTEFNVQSVSLKVRVIA